MSVLTTMTRFAIVWQNFSADANGQRIETAFKTIPRIVSPAQLPCVIIFPREATYNYDDYGENIVSETRKYEAQLMVSSALLGNEQTGEVIVEPYFSAVRDYFAARPGLEDDTETQPRTVVEECHITGDSGYVKAEYPTGSGSDVGMGIFHAIIFTFEVIEIASITFKD